MTYHARYVTETDEPSPWIDCAWASGCMWLDKGFEGTMPLVDKDVLRAKSGDKVGGSSIDDLARGVTRLFPSVTMERPRISDWDQIEAMGRSGYGFALLVDHGSWNTRLRRWSPSFRGGHWVYIEDVRGSTWRLLNPLGRPAASYHGEAATSAEIRAGADFYLRKNGAYVIAPVLEGSLMQTTTTVTSLPAPQTFTIAPDEVFGWRYDADTGRYERSTVRKVTSPTKVGVDATVRVEQFPLRNRSPYGTFVRVLDGSFAGLIVPSRFGAMDPAPPQPVDCGKLVADATAPLLKRLDDLDRIASPEVPTP